MPLETLLSPMTAGRDIILRALESKLSKKESPFGEYADRSWSEHPLVKQMNSDPNAVLMDSPGAPSFAMTPRPGNLKDVINELHFQRGKGLNRLEPLIDTNQRAVEFMNMRYPRLSSQVPMFEVGFEDPRTVGRYSDWEWLAKHSDNPDVTKLSVSPYVELNNLPVSRKTAAETIAHEMIHARQDFKGKMPLIEERLKAKTFEEYMAQPHEIEAYRKQTPAGKGIENLDDLVEKYGTPQEKSNYTDWSLGREPSYDLDTLEYIGDDPLMRRIHEMRKRNDARQKTIDMLLNKSGEYVKK